MGKKKGGGNSQAKVFVERKKKPSPAPIARSFVRGSYTMVDGRRQGSGTLGTKTHWRRLRKSGQKISRKSFLMMYK